MKRKVFLPLLEQICMIGFFALAAVLCLQGFTLANGISRDRQIKDYAVIAAQNTAEVLKSTKGDLDVAAKLLSGTADATSLTVLYDAEGNPTSGEENEAFRLSAQITDSEDPLLGCSTIRVIYQDEVILELTVGWQEGSNEAG